MLHLSSCSISVSFVPLNHVVGLRCWQWRRNPVQSCWWYPAAAAVQRKSAVSVPDEFTFDRYKSTFPSTSQGWNAWNSTSMQILGSFWRTKNITISTFVNQWYRNKWPHKPISFVYACSFSMRLTTNKIGNKIMRLPRNRANIDNCRSTSPSLTRLSIIMAAGFRSTCPFLSFPWHNTMKQGLCKFTIGFTCES